MADPGELLRDLIQKNFPQFGSIRKLCQIDQMPGQAVYDANTGGISAPPIASHTLYMIWDKLVSASSSPITSKTDDVTILSTDQIVLFPARDLPTFEPKVGDRIIDDELVSWSVVGVTKDPAKATFELHVRPI